MNHGAIVSEFGRETADRALVVTASVLRSAITDIDLAAPVGEHDFALLLEGPTSRETATVCAQQVIARGLQQSGALPDKEFDAPGSVGWLRDAVNAMRPDARRAIRPPNF